MVEKYCNALTHNKDSEFDDPININPGRMYICKITQIECIARKIIPAERSHYVKARINEEMLRFCPAWNPSEELIQELIERRNTQDSNLR